MSNKKLFWVAFFTLSLFEFGQFAYSKNISATIQDAKISDDALLCNKEHSLNSDFVVKRKLTSDSLPR